MAMKQGTWTLLLLGAAHSLNHSLFLVLPPLLEEISRDLGVSFQTIGLVTTVSFLLYGVGALVGGPLSDRFGEVRIAGLSITLSGVSTLVFLLPQGLPAFSAGMLLVAAWASFYHPITNTLINKLFVENTGGAMGVHGAAGSLGQIFTPTVAYLLGVYLNWRFAFVFFGILSMVAGLLFRVIPSPESTQRGSVPLLKVLAVPNIWVIILFNIFIGLFQRGVELFFPTFLTLNRGFSGQAAALANSVMLLFAVFGQLIGGWASDRFGSVKVVIVSSIGMVASILILLGPLGFIGAVLFILTFGVAFYGHQPAMTALLGRVSPREMMGTAYGLMFFFAFGLGSVSATIVGYIADAFDLERAFWIMAAFSAVALAIALVIPRIIKEDMANNEQALPG
jgi:sugar phosphate permease